MAFEFPGQCITMDTTQNLSAKKYHPISVNASGNAILAVTADGFSLGVLQNNTSTAGGACTVMISGVTKAAKISTATTGIDERDAITVGSTLGGFLPSSGGVYILGRALTPITTVTTGYFSMLITHEGAASSQKYVGPA